MGVRVRVVQDGYQIAEVDDVVYDPDALRHEREVDMAQRTQVLLTCDVHDGDAEAGETVLYTVEGRSYECDLCDHHLTEFRYAMEIWSSHSRPARRRRGGATTGRAAKLTRTTRGRAGDATSTANVRAWARAEGIPVGTRGRVPPELHAAYQAAHGA